MIEGLLSYLTRQSVAQLAIDALDVIIVYYLVYRALLVLKGTRAMQIGIGMGAVFLLYLAAQVLELVTVLSILSALISSIILVIVVVFQNDIRRGLMRVGSGAWFTTRRDDEVEVIDEVVQAATELARHRIGAIIAFERDANLDEFVGTNKGHSVDAEVSRELLVSLFVPEAMNKLHDGAVIIRDLRVAKAGVFFPMPEGNVTDASFGSRHRAAIGITEETDAVLVVVSEERGTISLCFNGNIVTNLDGPGLAETLVSMLAPKAKRPPVDAKSEEGKPKSAPKESAAAATPVPTEEETAPMPKLRQKEPDSTPHPLRGRTSEAPTPLRRRDGDDDDDAMASGVDSEPALRSELRASSDSEPPPPLRKRESEPPPPLRPRDSEAPASLRRPSRDSTADDDDPGPLSLRRPPREEEPSESPEPPPGVRRPINPMPVADPNEATGRPIAPPPDSSRRSSTPDEDSASGGGDA